MEPSFLIAGAGDAILCTRQIASLMVMSRFAKGQAAGRSGRGFGQRDEESSGNGMETVAGSSAMTICRTVIAACWSMPWFAPDAEPPIVLCNDLPDGLPNGDPPERMASGSAASCVSAVL